MEMSFLGGKSWKLLPWKNNSQQLILKLKTTQKLMTNKKITTEKTINTPCSIQGTTTINRALCMGIYYKMNDWIALT